MAEESEEDDNNEFGDVTGRPPGRQSLPSLPAFPALSSHEPLALAAKAADPLSGQAVGQTNAGIEGLNNNDHDNNDFSVNSGSNGLIDEGFEKGNNEGGTDNDDSEQSDVQDGYVDLGGQGPHAAGQKDDNNEGFDDGNTGAESSAGTDDADDDEEELPWWDRELPLAFTELAQEFLARHLKVEAFVKWKFYGKMKRLATKIMIKRMGMDIF